jgi:outer membrane usher protein FimD/PapC
VKGLYSIKKQIDYQNEEMQVQMDWQKTNDFLPGEYIVEIYENGVDIGRTKFELK